MKKTKMLKKNYEFKIVLDKGKCYSGKYIVIFVKRNNKNSNFLGIAISSKLGNAVKRNYLKRIIREVYKNTEEQIKTGYNIVFLWKKKSNIEKACYDNIKKDTIKIFKDAEMFLEE
jgi:ribonuclease P protein component